MHKILHSCSNAITSFVIRYKGNLDDIRMTYPIFFGLGYDKKHFFSLTLDYIVAPILKILKTIFVPNPD